MSAAIASTEIVQALAASHVRPSVGQTVRLYAAWAGAWPADVTWEGVDRSAGLLAEVVPKVAGPLVVRAGTATLTLDVQPAGDLGTTVLRPDVRAYTAIEEGGCRDDRYPSLAGAWVVGCSSSGAVNRAAPVEGGQRADLDGGGPTPGLGPATILAANLGVWHLPDAVGADVSRSAVEVVGPPATDGTYAALVYPTAVEVFPLVERTHTRTDAAPVPWYAAALAWPWAAWVEDGGVTGEDIWARDPDGNRRALARTGASERHPVGSGRWLGWVDEAGVHVQDMERHERRSYAANTGFVYGPSLWGPVACWEDRGALVAGAGDIDVLCSDGVELRRKGDQRAPARWGPWILFRESGQLMMATAPELILDDDDPRASTGGTTIDGGWRGAHRDQPVSWTLDWPAPGWRVERWSGAGWDRGEPVGVGLVTVESPSGDAVRLVRDAP
jgi:hypothetical protein